MSNEIWNIMDEHTTISSFQSSFPQNLETLYHFAYNIIDKNRAYKISDIDLKQRITHVSVHVSIVYDAFAKAKKKKKKLETRN